jgi:hypothetical protein
MDTSKRQGLMRFLERHGAAWDRLCQAKIIPRRGMIARRYAASKGSVGLLTKRLAQEVASRPIRVNGTASAGRSAAPLLPCEGQDFPP